MSHRDEVIDLMNSEVSWKQRAEAAEARARESDALAKSAEDDCQRAINRAQKAEHDVKCLQESTVDSKAFEQMKARVRELEEALRQAEQRGAERGQMADWLEGIKRRHKAARDMVTNLCEGRRQWIMRIPAEPDYDPDLVICAALADIPKLIEEVRELRKAREADCKALTSEREIRP